MQDNNVQRGQLVPAERHDEGGQLLAIVQSIALTPNVNVEAVNVIAKLYSEAKAEQQERALSQALSRAQANVEPVRRDMHNPQTRSRYASYAAVNGAVRPVFNAEGLFVSFNTQPSTPANPVPELMVRVVAILEHRDGGKRKYEIDMPADGKGAKGNDVMTRTHATGAGFSYGRRYLWLGIADLPMDDDDGNGASRATSQRVAVTGPATGPAQQAADRKLSAEEAEKVKARIEMAKADNAKFLQHFRVTKVEDMTLSQGNQAMTMLNTKITQAKAAQANGARQPAQQQQRTTGDTLQDAREGRPGPDNDFGWPGPK